MEKCTKKSTKQKEIHIPETKIIREVVFAVND